MLASQLRLHERGSQARRGGGEAPAQGSSPCHLFHSKLGSGCAVERPVEAAASHDAQPFHMVLQCRRFHAASRGREAARVQRPSCLIEAPSLRRPFTKQRAGPGSAAPRRVQQLSLWLCHTHTQTIGPATRERRLSGGTFEQCSFVCHNKHSVNVFAKLRCFRSPGCGGWRLC